MSTGNLFESHPRAAAGVAVHCRRWTLPVATRNTVQNVARHPGGWRGVRRRGGDMGVRVVPEIRREMSYL